MKQKFKPDPDSPLLRSQQKVAKAKAPTLFAAEALPLKSDCSRLPLWDLAVVKERGGK
jgi:hypothetical protein